MVVAVFAHEVKRRPHGRRDRQLPHVARKLLEESQQPWVLRPQLMEECRDTKVFQLLTAHAELPAERDRPFGDAEAVTSIVPLTGLEMEGHQLEHCHVRALEILEPGAPLIGECADGVSGQNEEPGPRDHREQEPEVQSRSDRRRAIEANERLEEGDEDDDEDRRPNGAAPAEIEPSSDDR